MVLAAGAVGGVAVLVFWSGPCAAVCCVAEVPGFAWLYPAAWLEADDRVAVGVACVDDGFPFAAEGWVVAGVAALLGGSGGSCHVSQRSGAGIRRCRQP